MGKQDNIIIVGVIVSLILLGTGCQPTPERLVPLPTVASLPTLTPLPTQTFTPIPTITPFPTFTPRSTRIPIPTETPDANAPVRACVERAENSLALLRAQCADSDVDTVCHGSSQIEETIKPRRVDEERVEFLGPGSTLLADDVDTLNLSQMDTERGLWGTTMIRIANDFEGQLPEDELITILGFGGTVIQNLSPRLSEQRENIQATPSNQRGAYAYPFGRLMLVTSRPPIRCQFVPVGIVVQTSTPAVLEVNRTLIEFVGTVHITVNPGEFMRVVPLEGDVTWRFPETQVVIPEGSQTEAQVDLEGMPQSLPNDLVPYDTTLNDSLFRTGLVALRLLPRQIVAPDPVSEAQLILLNSYAGDWVVTTEVTELAGLLAADETPTLREIDDALDLCVWRGAWLLGKPSEFTYRLRPREDDPNVIGIEAYYPDVLFPRELVRFNMDEPIFEGEITGAEESLFVHRLTFTSPTTFEWVVEASGLPGDICSSGTVIGEGIRVSSEGDSEGSDGENNWRVTLLPGDFYEPSTRSIADCLNTDLLNMLPDTAFFDVVQDDQVQINAELTGIEFPSFLAPDLLINDTFVGSVVEDDQEFIHRLKFNSDGSFTWRIMVRSLSNNCRQASIEGTGFRIDDEN